MPVTLPLRLGVSTPLPANPAITEPGIGFTGIPGSVLAMPGNIVPGVTYTGKVNILNMTASLTLSAALTLVQWYNAILRQSAVVTYRATARAFAFLTRNRIQQ